MSETFYTLTPPDIRISLTGPSILILGVPFDEIGEYTELLDQIYSGSDITVFTSENGINHENIAWYRAISGMIRAMIVDIGNITPEETAIAMHSEFNTNTNIFWVNSTGEESVLYKLLNSYSIKMYDCAQDLPDFLNIS